METATPTQEGTALPDVGDEDHRELWEKTQAELDTENQKPKRSHSLKEKKTA